MDATTAPFLLAISIISGLLGVVCALAYLRAGFRSTRNRKSPPETPIPTSDARFAKVEGEMAELWSTLESLTTTVKRISSRRAMQNRRGTSTGDEPPPVGASKAELREYYGLNGKSHQEIAERARSGNSD